MFQLITGYFSPFSLFATYATSLAPKTCCVVVLNTGKLIGEEGFCLSLVAETERKLTKLTFCELIDAIYTASIKKMNQTMAISDILLSIH